MWKTPGDIILLHMCTINQDHMMYGSWYIMCKGEFFVSLDYFLPFDPPNNPKNKNFEKNKKNLWTYYHFALVQHKWQSFNVWFVRYQVQLTEIFVILGYFLHFTVLTAQKIKISRKYHQGDIIILH